MLQLQIQQAKKMIKGFFTNLRGLFVFKFHSDVRLRVFVDFGGFP